MRGGWVYIVTNRPNGTLYLGVTSDLARRAWQHRTGEITGFTKRYGLGRLVWYEAHDDIRTAIQREKTMKHWSRAWKVRVILDANPDWSDLYEVLNARSAPSPVMAALVAAIHADGAGTRPLRQLRQRLGVGARDKPGHDDDHSLSSVRIQSM